VLSTDEIAEQFGVSGETIRRDIAHLEQQGKLVRVHGGAMSVNTPSHVKNEESFEIRSAEMNEAKRLIGNVAAGLIHDGDIVSIDIGTTALQIARSLPAEFRGVVATPSLPVAIELAGRPGIDVLLSGGLVRGGDLACSNNQAVDFYRGIRPDVAFVSSGGVSAADGLTDFHREEVATRQQMIRNSNRSYIIADSRKLGKIAPYRVCDLTDVTGIITDRHPPEPVLEEFRQLAVDLILPTS
jgi:DeoR family fructose operon transcriptional repressor